MNDRVKYLVTMSIVLVIVVIGSIILAFYCNSVKYELNDKAEIIKEEWKEVQGKLDKRYSILKELQLGISEYSKYQADSIDYIIKERDAGSVTSEIIADMKYKEFIDNLESSCPEIVDTGNYEYHKGKLDRVDEELNILIEKYDNDVREYNRLKNSFPRNMVAYFFNAENLYVFKYN